MWDLEKGYVTQQSPRSCHHWIPALGWEDSLSCSSSTEWATTEYYTGTHPQVFSTTPKLGPSHCPFPAWLCLHSNPLWELESWPQTRLEPHCLILASFLPRSLVPNFMAAQSSTHRLPSRKLSFLIYEMEVILSPPKVKWSYLCTQ